MPLIIIPTRIVPGCAVGALFAAAGMFSGIAAGLLFTAPGKLKLAHIIALPVLLGACWVIKYAWGRDTTLAKVSQLSPRLFAVICAVCLGVGLATGVLVATPLMDS